MDRFHPIFLRPQPEIAIGNWEQIVFEEILVALQFEDHFVVGSFEVGQQGGIGVLRGMVRLAQRNEERPGLVRLYVVLGSEATAFEHPAHEYFIRHYARIVNGTRRALESAQSAGAPAIEGDPLPDDGAYRRL